MTRRAEVGVSPRAPTAPVARHFPLTLALLGTILVTAAWTHTLARPLTPEALERFGFALGNLRDGQWLHLLTAPFFVLRPWMAITISAILLVFVGSGEYLIGTRRTAVAFLTGHVAGFVMGPLALAGLALLGSPWARSLADLPDVGASNGAFGVAGVLTAMLGRRLRRPAFLGFLAFHLSMLWLRHEIWDMSHLLAYGSGALLGAFLARQGRRERPRVWPQLRVGRRQRTELLAWLIGGTAVVNILAAFALPHHPRLAAIEAGLPIGLPHVSRHLLLATGCVLLALVPSLARGARAGWWGALVAVAVSSALHALLNPSWLEGGLALGIVVVLWRWRSSFTAGSDPPSLGHGRKVLLGLFAGVPAYTLSGMFLLRSQFDPSPFPTPWLAALLDRLGFGITDAIHAHGHIAAWFLDSIPLVFWGWLLFGVILVARGVSATPATSPDRTRARIVFQRHGWCGTAAMSLWEGNSIYFSEDGEAYLAYRVHAGIAVVLGDPIGPESQLPLAIEAFTAHAVGQGWEPVFYACSWRMRARYETSGFRTLKIGEEAVLPLGQLEFRGRAWQNVRSAINRAEREGLEFRMYEGGTIPVEVRSQLISISEEWQSRQRLPPMGFTLGKVEDVDDPGVTVALALDRSGAVQAFIDWLPVPARAGWVIDLMRRREDAMSAVVEYLIGTSLLTFKERGDRMASLATAPLANTDPEPDASMVQRALTLVFERGGGLYRFRSLFTFKSRFQPTWEPVYLAYRDPSRLPAIALATLRCHLPSIDAATTLRAAGRAIAERLFPGAAEEENQEPGPGSQG